MTDKEKSVLKNLVEAWNNYVHLEIQHMDDLQQFRHHLHQLQYILGIRATRRDYPEIYNLMTN
jgi:hypothetical protein